MISQILRPKFMLVALALLVCGRQATANPIPDDNTVDSVADKVTGFFDRVKNTFSSDSDENQQKLSSTEIILISVGAILILLFLSCCILACLCECVKEILCCICCCGRNT